MIKIFWAAVAASVILVAQPSGEDLIRKNIDAHGGVEKIQAVKTLQLTGKALIGGQIEAPMVYRSKRPTRYRTEIQIQGRLMTEAFDGSVNWISEGISPSKAPEENAKRAADNADPIGSPLFNYREKGHVVEFAGKETVEGQECYKFTVKLNSGNHSTVYVDAKSYLTFIIVTKSGDLEAQSKLSDYRRVSGVLIPFSNTININGQKVMVMNYQKAEVNVPLDDSLFVMPPVKSK